jgi:thiosulfate dehydrogenase
MLIMRFLLGVLIGLLILPVCGWLYVYLGYAPVATASSPMPFERRLAHMALDARIRKEAPKNSPITPSDENYLAGAQLYRTHCAVCHGLPGQQKTPTAQGMFPEPPQLFKGHGVTDDPPGETYWKVTNGIRLTGMPAYGSPLTETQRWQISLLLAYADKLPAQATDVLNKPFEVQ